MRTLFFKLLSRRGGQVINIKSIDHARLKLRKAFRMKDIDQGVVPKA